MNNLQETIMKGISSDIELAQSISSLKKRLAFLGYNYDETKDGAILTWINKQKEGSDDTTKALLSSLSITIINLIMTVK